MKKLFSTTFNGYDIFTYLWDNKLCWVAIQIINSFNYLNPSKTISDCINREHFSRGIDYDVLEKDNLRRFKVNLNLNTTDFRYAPKLVIFYESGLFGFLNYSEKPEATPFKCLVRQEILPSIIKNGYYVTSDFKENSCSSETNTFKEEVKNSPLNIVDENKSILIEKILYYLDISDISPNAKLNLLLNLYESLGITIGNKFF